MFQTSPGNARLVAAFAAAAPHPAGDSSLVEAYRFLPNDTDLSELLDAGRPGMNFAFIEGAARYHTPGDSPANLSTASVQHHGSSMLALAAELGGTDLAPFDPAVSGAEPAGDATYFERLGAFVTYPEALAHRMTAIPVEIAPPRRAIDEEDIVVIGDVDEFTERRIVCGCGDDNPYR